MDPEPQKKLSKLEKLQSVIPAEIREKWTQEQLKIRGKIVQADDHAWTVDTIRLICGVDLSANKDEPDLACVGLVVYDIKEHRVQYEDYEIVRISQPYIPGYLAFREVPPLFQMFKRLKANKPEAWPELVIIDGNGILHSNQCGLACHLGVLIDVPALGVGKTLFFIDGLGKDQVKKLCDEEIKKQNDFALLKGDSGKIWGAGLRNGKSATNPVFVSVGTKITLETAIKCVIMSSIHRVPEPVRLADKRSREIIEGIDIKGDNSKYKKQHAMIVAIDYDDQTNKNYHNFLIILFFKFKFSAGLEQQLIQLTGVSFLKLTELPSLVSDMVLLALCGLFFLSQFINISILLILLLTINIYFLTYSCNPLNQYSKLWLPVYFCILAMFLLIVFIIQGNAFTSRNCDSRVCSFFAKRLLVKYSWIMASIYYLLNFVPGPPVFGVRMLQNSVLDRSLSIYLRERSKVLVSFYWFNVRSSTRVSSQHILCGSIFSNIFWKSSPIFKLFSTEFIRVTYLVLAQEKPYNFFIRYFDSVIQLSEDLILRTASLILLFSRLNLFSNYIFSSPYYFLVRRDLSMFYFRIWILQLVQVS